MSSKELIQQIEALAQVNTAYESQLLELRKAVTASDAEAKRSTADLKLTKAGLANSETHVVRLTNEIAQLKTKLSAEVQANATNKLHWSQKEAELIKSHGQLQKEHDATVKTLKAMQLTLQHTQVECTELKTNLTATRDKYGTTRALLLETERLLGLESKSKESFQLAAAQAKRDYELLQESLPKQIQALNDAKSAAMHEAASTKMALEAANLMVGERENELKNLRAMHQALINKCTSDRLAAAEESAQLKAQKLQLSDQIGKLEAVNAIGDRQLMLEVRAKNRSDAEGNKSAQKATELSGRNTNLAVQVKALRDELAAERDEHRRTSIALAEIAAGKEAAAHSVACEQKKNNDLSLKLSSETRRADDLQQRLKALTAQTSVGSSGGGGALSPAAAAAVQRAIKQQGRLSIASMRASARAESVSPTRQTGAGDTQTSSPTMVSAVETDFEGQRSLAPAKFAV